MGKSHADMRKSKAAERARNGVELDVSGKVKKAAAPKVPCSVCRTEFKATARNIEMKSHWESKHPKQTFDQCFPGQIYEGM